MTDRVEIPREERRAQRGRPLRDLTTVALGRTAPTALIRKNGISRPRDVRIEQHQALAEPALRALGDREPLHFDTAVSAKPERAESAICGDVLVLLPYGLAADVDLDFARFARHLLGR